MGRDGVAAHLPGRGRGDAPGLRTPGETTVGEPASTIAGPRAEVRWTLLDPWPGTDADMATGLASMERKNFLKLLTDRGDLFKPVGQRSPPPPLILRVVIGGGRPDHAENPAEGLAKGKGEECPTR